MSPDFGVRAITWSTFDKAIGGSGVIFQGQTQIKVLIAGVSPLFTECQNSTLLRRYDC